MPRADNELDKKINDFLTRKFSEHPELIEADDIPHKSFANFKPQNFGA